MSQSDVEGILSRLGGDKTVVVVDASKVKGVPRNTVLLVFTVAPFENPTGELMQATVDSIRDALRAMQLDINFMVFEEPTTVDFWTDSMLAAAGLQRKDK